MAEPLNVIVDLSHFNGNVDLTQAQAASTTRTAALHGGVQSC